MEKNKVRVFVTTSHLSTVLITLYAKSTYNSHTKDFLIVDTGNRRKELLQLISETSEFHTWEKFSSFSDTVQSVYDFRPTLSRNFIRKIKYWPITKQFYNLLLNQYLKQRDIRYRKKLSAVIPNAPGSSVELFLMSQTYLNRPLRQIFPDASVSFMEHGIGDYFYVMNEQHPKSKMFAVFANGYKNYLLNKRIKSDWVYEITGLSDFHLLAQHLIKKHNRTLCLFEIPAISKPIVFILLEAVDMYNVPESFWTDYLDHILEQLDSPQRFHFLLKTHPVQSKISVVISEFFFQDKNLEYTLLADDKLSSASAEVLFNLWFPNTEHVFCLFSSGCFYLSQLYKDKPITFWYSTEFFSRYIKNAPPQYKIHFEEIRPLIEQVFAERCKSY